MCQPCEHADLNTVTDLLSIDIPGKLRTWSRVDYRRTHYQGMPTCGDREGQVKYRMTRDLQSGELIAFESASGMTSATWNRPMDRRRDIETVFLLSDSPTSSAFMFEVPREDSPIRNESIPVESMQPPQPDLSRIQRLPGSGDLHKLSETTLPELPARSELRSAKDQPALSTSSRTSRRDLIDNCDIINGSPPTDSGGAGTRARSPGGDHRSDPGDARDGRQDRGVCTASSGDTTSEHGGRLPPEPAGSPKLGDTCADDADAMKGCQMREGKFVGYTTLNELMTSARVLDRSVEQALSAAVMHDRLHLAEVCCTSDSRLTNEVRSRGGRAERYSSWNGFDLTTKKGRDLLWCELQMTRPKVVWFSPPCGAESPPQNINQRTPEQRATLHQKQTRSRRIQKNVRWIISRLLDENISIPVLEQPKDNGAWRGHFAGLYRNC